MNRWIANFIVAASCLAAGARDVPKGRVMFWYDTEDYTCPAADEGTLFHAKLLTEFGFRGNFNIVGFYAQRLNELGRKDVIDALKAHCLGSQTLYHSRHPVISEYTDVADWDAAYRRCLAEESECIGMLRAVFGLDEIKLFVPPGNNVTPVAQYVYSDRGVKFAAGMTDLLGAVDYDHLVWYCNMVQVPYSPFLWMKYNGLPPTTEDMASRHLTCISTHPNELVTDDFWDKVNYLHENKVEWRKWKEPKLLKPEVQAAERAKWRALMERVKADKRLRVVTCDDLEKDLLPRVAIRRADAAMLLAKLSKGLDPIREPASWSVSDVFQAAVAFLRGEDEYLPAKAWGFLERPVGVTAPTTVRADDVKAAAAKLNANCFLPPQIEVGGRKIGPADFLIAALTIVAEENVGAASCRTKEIALTPRDQLGPMERHLPGLVNLRLGNRRGWPIYSDDFKDRYVTDRLRWQFWTLRYEW